MGMSVEVSVGEGKSEDEEKIKASFPTHSSHGAGGGKRTLAFKLKLQEEGKNHSRAEISWAGTTTSRLGGKYGGSPKAAQT
ncbi:hypothetical protein E2C01_025940 [Portunus trituberculatus]|uniref:Uncharacterized protein n=1 Tax=Portunus trituberculatus TaxID=210409 RepID=A0A5B7EHC4_PORTR|nr:hypothetical protein [Portunus trituberculatus]